MSDTLSGDEMLEEIERLVIDLTERDRAQRLAGARAFAKIAEGELSMSIFDTARRIRELAALPDADLLALLDEET